MRATYRRRIKQKWKTSNFAAPVRPITHTVTTTTHLIWQDETPQPKCMLNAHNFAEARQSVASETACGPDTGN